MPGLGICEVCDGTTMWFPDPSPHYACMGKCGRARQEQEQAKLAEENRKYKELCDLSALYDKEKRLPNGVIQDFYDWYKAKLYPHPLENKDIQEYAFTLTAPPSHSRQPEHFTQAVEQLIKTGMTSKYERISKCAYVIEYHDNGAPHLHGVYHTGGPRRITTKSFQRVWKLWDPRVPMGAGFQGGYHEKIRHGQSYSDYIAKGDGMGNQAKVYSYEK